MGDVGILIFIDQNIFEPALILVQHIGVVLKYMHHMQQQIAKIGGIQIAQPGLIGGIQVRPLAIIGRRIGQRHRLRAKGAVFPAVDDSRQHPGGPAFFVNSGDRYQLFQQPDLVVGIQNGKGGFQPHQLGMATQQFDTDRMERAQPRHPLGHLAQQPAHTAFHLARGLVGERHRQNLVRAGPARGQQMHDAAGQRLGLAGACACQHQHRPIQRLDRGTLCGVQIIQIGGRPRRHGLARQRDAGRILKGVVIVVTAHNPRP